MHVDATAKNINTIINNFRRKTMPLIDVHVIKNVFNSAQKKEIIEKMTETMVQIEGEALRGVTWVRINEINEGDWAIGGQQLTAAAVHAMQKG
jgi:4-oxalocrotonate tautomerase